MCRWEEARGVPDQVVRLACQALHMVRLAPSPNNTKECVAPDMLRALPEQIDEPASLVATFFQACMGAQVEFNAPLALLPETLDEGRRRQRSAGLVEPRSIRRRGGGEEVQVIL
jgi:hypothetical protein